MNGIHDLGGMHGFGPIRPEPDEPVFHHDWERRVFGVMMAAFGGGHFNVDQFRHAIERMGAPDYLRALAARDGDPAPRARDHQPGGAREEVGRAVEGDCLMTVITKDIVPVLINTGGSTRVDQPVAPRFRPGDHVVVRNLNPEHHTRLPRYARAKRGIIERDHGVFVFPDTSAHDQGAKPQHVYSVRFTARELWGGQAAERDTLRLDLWDDYLDLAL